jgi:hypothetical protein
MHSVLSVQYRPLNETGMSFNLTSLAHNSLEVIAVNIASRHKLLLCFVTMFHFCNDGYVQLQPSYEEAVYSFCFIFINFSIRYLANYLFYYMLIFIYIFPRAF